MTRQEFIADFRAARLAAKFRAATPTPVGRSCVAARRVKPPVPFILRWDERARSVGTVYLHMQAHGLALAYHRKMWAARGFVSLLMGGR